MLFVTFFMMKQNLFIFTVAIFVCELKFMSMTTSLKT
jgi:hypothetical protein